MTKRVLGKGLGALITTEGTESAEELHIYLIYSGFRALL